MVLNNIGKVVGKVAKGVTVVVTTVATTLKDEVTSVPSAVKEGFNSIGNTEPKVQDNANV